MGIQHYSHLVKKKKKRLSYSKLKRLIQILTALLFPCQHLNSSTRLLLYKAVWKHPDVRSNWDEDFSPISASGMDRGESCKWPEGLYCKKKMKRCISSTPSLAPFLNSCYCLRTHYASCLRPLSNGGKDYTHYIISISNLENSVT